MKAILFAATCVIAALMTAVPAHGKFAGASQLNTGGEYMAHVFGKNAAFTATAVSTVGMAGRGGQEVETQYAVLDGNMRTETDMTRMKGGAMPLEAVAQMKQMGMDRTVVIHRSAENKTYMIYPGLKSYCVISAAKADGTGETKPPKIERTEVGKETVEGHPCVKYKLTMTMDGGRKVDMLVWQAADLNQFPIKTEATHDNTTITTVFRDIKMTRSDASLFQVPAGFKADGSMHERMMSVMGAMLGGFGGAPR